jgi:D-serine deaminase-like pyridoxal phosphate-dependent protein
MTGGVMETDSGNLLGQHVDDLDTPVALVDLDRLEANIQRLQSYLDGHGIANRPHIKTHKIPSIARMQVDAGAAGITCQKLGEAEVMAEAGIEDIFIPYNILGQSKLERLVRLARSVRVSVTADSEVTVSGLSAAAREAAIELPVLVEFDSGLHRCGVQSPQEAAVLARVIARSPGLRFGGLMTYPSNDAAALFVRETGALLAADGIKIKRASGGSTPGMWQAHLLPEFTEYRAGTYVYGDRATIRAGVMSVDECAFTIRTTVVSRPTATRGILDGGSKTFTSDLLGMEGHGLLLEYPGARFYAMSEEHGNIDFSSCASAPEIGEQVTVIPNHCCVVSNLFDQIVGVRKSRVEVVWPVAARGAVH